MSRRTAKLSTPYGRLRPVSDDAKNLVSTGHHAHDLRESEKESAVHNAVHKQSTDFERVSTQMSTSAVDGRVAYYRRVRQADSVNDEKPPLRLVKDDDGEPADLAARIRLALSILNHRTWHPDDLNSADDVRRALEGASIRDILEGRE